MKAISLWQPWATAMAIGSKRIETRSWSTHYRGLLAIHASKRCVQSEITHISAHWNWCGALRPVGLTMGGDEDLKDLLPFGAIVAVGNLVDVRPTGRFTVEEIETVRYPFGEKEGSLYGWTERQMGNYDLGRFGWVFDWVKPLKEPIPFKGAQGFFNVPDEVLEGKY